MSDPLGIIANPLTVVHHIARARDAAQIADIAKNNDVGLIIIGIALDIEGNPGYQARKSMRLMENIKLCTDIPIELWDESWSTKEARNARKEMVGHHRLRNEHLDDVAATVILQTYIEAHR